jgi:hypothetical protein
MAPSGILRLVALVRYEVSEELGASLMMVVALRSSETSVLTRTTQHNIQEDAILQSHRRGNLKSYSEYLNSNPANRKRRRKGNPVSHETVIFGYGSFATLTSE